jgi:hypothetical protein
LVFTFPQSDKPETPTIRPDVEGQIREFVETERERVDKKKSTIVKSERERKLQELKKFGKDFQVSDLDHCIQSSVLLLTSSPLH